MADDADREDKIQIHPPDRTLQAKIGNVSLDQVLSPQVIRGAENAIADSAEDFLAESLTQTLVLDRAYEALRRTTAEADAQLQKIADTAFAIKTKAGLGGYTLAAALAKSLQAQCERLIGKPPGGRDLDIIGWHILSIRQLLTGRIKGDGGEAGNAILAEIERLG